MTVEAEEVAARCAFERAEGLEDLAAHLPGDVRGRQFEIAHSLIADLGPIRPRVAGVLLGLTEKTVRAWAAEGALVVDTRSPRLALDPMSVHKVYHVVRDVRAAGKTRGLLDEVWRRLSDEAALADPLVREGLTQFHDRRGTLVVPDPHRRIAGPVPAQADKQARA